MDIASFDIAVRTCEIDIFHGTHRMALRLCIELAADSMMVKSHDLTRFNVSDILCSEHFECTCLTGHDITVTDLTYSKRMETIFVAARIYTTACHHDKRKGSVNLVKRILDRIDARQVLVHTLLLDQMGQNLSI